MTERPRMRLVRSNTGKVQGIERDETARRRAHERFRWLRKTGYFQVLYAWVDVKGRTRPFVHRLDGKTKDEGGVR